MKSLLILSIFVLTAAAQLLTKPLPPIIVEAWRAIIHPYIDECFAETGAKSEVVDRFFLYRDYPDNRPLKCFMKCQAFKFNFMDVKGEIYGERIIRQIGVPTDIVDKCTKFKGRDLCERAWMLATCVYTAATDIFFIPNNPHKQKINNSATGINTLPTVPYTDKEGNNNMRQVSE